MKNSCLAVTVVLALASTWADAADLPQPNVNAPLPAPAISTGSTVPNSAFFLGLGASANWTNFGHQHVYAIGTSNVLTDGVLAASGSAQRELRHGPFFCSCQIPENLMRRYLSEVEIRR